MWVHPSGKETTGALDLGGASTQISFAAEEKVGLNTSDIMKVTLYGYEYTLYTHSFQCYGRNEAEKRFLATLLQVPEPRHGLWQLLILHSLVDLIRLTNLSYSSFYIFKQF